MAKVEGGGGDMGGGARDVGEMSEEVPNPTPFALEQLKTPAPFWGDQLERCSCRPQPYTLNP